MDHVAGEVLQQLGGFRMTHVPYKGPGASLQDLVAGRLDCLISSPIPVKPHADAGNLRVIAVTSAERSPAMKDVPTIAEAGFPEFQMSSWYAYVAPAGTPREVVTRLNTEISRILRTPVMKERLATLGAEAMPDTPEAFAGFVKVEMAKYRGIVRASGAKAD